MIKPVQSELYAVVGNPVHHSLSPLMMAAAFRELNHPAVYVALQVDSFQEDMETLTKAGFSGLSVTIPHKQSAFALTARLDVTAHAIGAVNTLRRIDSGWEGCNTDWIGSNEAFASAVKLHGSKALVIGAGGAARAVVYGLKREGVHVTVCNRSEERGTALAWTMQCDFIPLTELQKAVSSHGFDLVAQCTPVGLTEGGVESIAPEGLFKPGMVVLDTVYRPLHTAFLERARKSGCKVIPGLEMLLWQGVAQLKFWLNLSSLPDHVVQSMRETIYKAVDRE